MIFGYIDAGSGTMLIQVLIAGIVAVPFFLRSTIARGIQRLRGRRAEPSAAASTKDSEDLP